MSAFPGCDVGGLRDLLVLPEEVRDGLPVGAVSASCSRRRLLGRSKRPDNGLRWRVRSRQYPASASGGRRGGLPTRPWLSCHGTQVHAGKAGPRKPGHAASAQDRGHALRHGVDRQVCVAGQRFLRYCGSLHYGSHRRAVAVRDASQVLPLRLLHGLRRCLPGRSTFRPGVGGGARREEFFDAVACYQEAVHQGVKAGGRIICGICIAACPHTRRYLAQESITTPPKQSR